MFHDEHYQFIFIEQIYENDQRKIIWEKDITTDLIYKEIIPKFYVVRDKDEKIGIRFQSEEDAILFNQSIKEILAEQVFQEYEYKIIQEPPQNVSPDSSNNEESEDDTEVLDSPDGIDDCYHRKGKLPPAPPSPPSHLLKSGGGFLPRVNTKDSNKYIPTRNQGGIKSSIIKELEKIRGGKRPDSEISISTARESTISSSDYRLTDWKLITRLNFL